MNSLLAEDVRAATSKFWRFGVGAGRRFLGTDYRSISTPKALTILLKIWMSSFCKHPTKYSLTFIRNCRRRIREREFKPILVTSSVFWSMGGKEHLLCKSSIISKYCCLIKNRSAGTDKQFAWDFELGFAAAEHRLMMFYEDYIHDGVAMAEWRHSGLPLAREERLRQGARTRKEILAAAKQLCVEDPTLIRND